MIFAMIFKILAMTFAQNHQAKILLTFWLDIFATWYITWSYHDVIQTTVKPV